MRRSFRSASCAGSVGSMRERWNLSLRGSMRMVQA